MAFRDYSISDPGNPAMGREGIPFIYNLSMAVGPAKYCANQRDDVMLVQFFLKEVYGNLGANDTFPYPTHLKPLEVDGWFGPTTQSWIVHYENSLPSVFKDGQVDRARGKKSSISKTVYKIIWMNSDFWNKAITLFPFEDLHKDARVPPLLRKTISP